MLKRSADFFITLCATFTLVVPMIFVWVAVKVTSSGPALYWSRRAGRNGSFFMMPKFRTMRLDTPEVATDKLVDPKKYLTPIGSFLRRTSLDELPQLLSVLRGDMSIVGPRPALHNQDELIAKRRDLGINILRPGITGWAQVNGRDEIDLDSKLRLDHEYLKHQSFYFDVKIIIVTILSVIRSRGVTH